MTPFEMVVNHNVVFCATILAFTLGGCATNYPVGSPQALAAANHRQLMNECMSSQTENIQEMTLIDPTFIYRKCRQHADSRVRHP